MRSIKHIVLLGILTSLLAGSGATYVEHKSPATVFACVGAKDASGKCDVVWAAYSVESRNGDQPYVNCPKGTPTQPECYQNYKDSQQSSGWGPSATTVLVPTTTAGPVTIGGVTYGTSGNSARVWTGLCVQGAGCGSVSVSGGQNTAGHPFVCVTVFGADESSGHAIAGALATSGVSDDGSDYETDGQVCGEAGRGV